MSVAKTLRLRYPNGSEADVPYRRAVGLLSLGRATLAPKKTKRKRRTKAEIEAAKLSTPTSGDAGQERDRAGNKPLAEDTASHGRS